MIDETYLQKICADVGIQLKLTEIMRFDRYAELLVEWNEKINLTAITEPMEISIKHFIDSLMLLHYCPLKNGSRLIDVGTGAGFPSLPCKLARPDLAVTLLDSLNKRVLFLQELTCQLDLQDVVCVHARAEEAGCLKEYRERFDCATARAVAHLRELSEYCLPFVRVGGSFIALKGGDVAAELKESEAAIRLLGGELAEIHNFILPDGSARSLLRIENKTHTPTKYPRIASKMKKNPL